MIHPIALASWYFSVVIHRVDAFAFRCRCLTSLRRRPHPPCTFVRPRVRFRSSKHPRPRRNCRCCPTCPVVDARVDAPDVHDGAINALSIPLRLAWLAEDDSRPPRTCGATRPRTARDGVRRRRRRRRRRRLCPRLPPRAPRSVAWVVTDVHVARPLRARCTRTPRHPRTDRVVVRRGRRRGRIARGNPPYSHGQSYVLRTHTTRRRHHALPDP